MNHRVTRLAALGCLVSFVLGCESHIAGTLPAKAPGLGIVMSCGARSDWCEQCPGAEKAPERTPGTESIDLAIHVMIATTVTPKMRKAEYKKLFDDRLQWAIAPVNAAVKSKFEMQVEKDKPAVPVEFWTTSRIRKVFGSTGLVNEIWRRYGIELSVRMVEDCNYMSEHVRPDGLLRDSVPTPQTTVPWTSQFYRSVNRLFTAEMPQALHVFLWWSIAEGDIDGANAVTLQGSVGGNGVWGYSRSAGHGGPGVWAGAYGCLTPLTGIDYERKCAKVIAHEVGHALGLQHVEEPRSNLMFKEPGPGYHEPGSVCVDPGQACSEFEKACKKEGTACKEQQKACDPKQACEDLAFGIIICPDQRTQAQHEAKKQFRSH